MHLQIRLRIFFVEFEHPMIIQLHKSGKKIQNSITKIGLENHFFFKWSENILDHNNDTVLNTTKILPFHFTYSVHIYKAYIISE
uniref:Uncharacterized protein n=1 Tax=Anguilla anguilla TaxID=7936 RepID=A0A0E9X6G6_ANGAN